ncbi:MAG: Crp/Fnr family transcriptional regulator [Bacteroidetes bacterium]|nr:Crp/Fnr family transcriptional regulator [Bacteroidota bacterium]
MDDIIRKHFPSLNDVNFVNELTSVAELIEIPAGETMMDYGRRIERIPMLYEGSVQVFRRDEEGHEIFLYYLQPGEACAISMVCSGHDKISKIRAETLEDSKFIAAPIKYMDEWVMNYKVWYRYVVDTYSLRFDEMLKSFDQIAFNKMDERINHFLKNHSKVTGHTTVSLTHQQIADALFTSREVVSRLLKQMENKSLVKLERHRIEVLY